GRSSRFGITSADCPLATEITEGPYTVRCQVGDTDSSLRVDVQKYVLPKFKIDVAFDKPYYLPGQPVGVTVRANYFHGQPVADGLLEVEAKADGPDGGVIFQQALRTDADGTANF